MPEGYFGLKCGILIYLKLVWWLWLVFYKNLFRSRYHRNQSASRSLRTCKSTPHNCVGLVCCSCWVQTREILVNKGFQGQWGHICRANWGRSYFDKQIQLTHKSLHLDLSWKPVRSCSTGHFRCSRLDWALKGLRIPRGPTRKPSHRFSNTFPYKTLHFQRHSLQWGTSRSCWWRTSSPRCNGHHFFYKQRILICKAILR